jgi:hypothetical protein
MRPATRAATLRSLGVEVLTGSRLRRVTRPIIGAWPLGRATRPLPPTTARGCGVNPHRSGPSGGQRRWTTSLG